jgi:hypothetical protein
MIAAARLRMLAICWIAVAGVTYAIYMLRHTYSHLTDGTGKPFGDDFINFWSGAYLTWHGHAATVYRWNDFHAFEQHIVGAPIDFYHYSYPPVMLLLTAPLGVVKYVPALFGWLIAGWLCFYVALRAVKPGRATLLLALATPAVFVSAIGGQNGTWTAALLGGGLTLLDPYPALAGVLFGLLIFKPQLGVLIPIALLAGRRFHAFIAAGITVALLIAATLVLYGSDLWLVYFHHASVLRRLILEDGSGVWHRMLSVFVAARRLGASVLLSYAVQGIFTLGAAITVALIWSRNYPAPARNAALIVGTFLATPYLQDYDLVMGAFVALWLMDPELRDVGARWAEIGAGSILLLPLFGALLGKLTGVDWGPLFILPVFAIVVRATLARPPAQHEALAIKSAV